MLIRKAVSADISEVMRVYKAARKYMKDHGNPTQWGDVYPPQSLVEEDISKNRLYVLTEDEIIHGVFAFMFGPDELYAEIDKGAPSYNVMHRMASDGILRGIGKAVLDFCKFQSDGKNIRADTHKDNITMQNVLLKNGFLPCGNVYIEECDLSLIVYEYSYKA
ncbi:MAG: N-acetyltransferase [Eubacteriales bacterium]